MQVRLMPPSSPETRKPQEAIANVSGSQQWAQAFHEGVITYLKNINADSSFRSDIQSLIELDVSQNSGTSENIDQIIINKEIDVEEWKKSLDYTDETLNKIIGDFLNDYNFKANTYNVEWFKTVINGIIENYEKEYSLTLDQETRKMLRNLITKMSFDKLCIKNP